MGIFNMFIVLPMLLQTLTFSTVYKYALNSDPTNVIRLVGVLLITAAISVMFVKLKKGESSDEVMTMAGGGH
jgi:maltose/moltooligosaccharide transporter